MSEHPGDQQWAMSQPDRSAAALPPARSVAQEAEPPVVQSEGLSKLDILAVLDRIAAGGFKDRVECALRRGSDPTTIPTTPDLTVTQRLALLEKKAQDWNAEADEYLGQHDALQALMETQQAALLALVTRWAERAKRERANDWNNTEDKMIWQSIHRERADVFSGCAADLRAALTKGAQSHVRSADD